MAGFDLKKFLEKLRRSWLLWVPLALVAILFVNALGFLLPPRYEAQATVRVHAPQSDGNIAVRDALSPEDRLKTIKNEITDFGFIARVAGRVGIATALHPDSVEYDRTIRRVIKDIVISVPTADTFMVHYTGDTPEVTVKVVEEILNEYIERSNSYWNNNAATKVEFYKSQYAIAQRQLEAILERINHFNGENRETIPEAITDYQRRLSQLDQEQLRAQYELRSVEETLAALQLKRRDTGETIESQRITQPNQELAALRKEKRELEALLRGLKENFQDQHPKVAETINRLAQVEAEIKEEEAIETAIITTTPNPQYQDVLNQITLQEMKRQTLAAQVAGQQAAMTDLRQRIESGPATKLQLDRLNQELLLARNQVAQLDADVKRAEELKAIESSGQGPTFVVYNAARKPTQPSSPNRIKIGAVSVVFGVLLAMGLVLLLTLLDTAVRSVEEARGMLKMPVLGVVQRIVSAREEARLRRRRRIQLASVGSFLFVITLVVVVSVTVYREPLALQLKNVRALIQR